MFSTQWLPEGFQSAGAWEEGNLLLGPSELTLDQTLTSSGRFIRNPTANWNDQHLVLILHTKEDGMSESTNVVIGYRGWSPEEPFWVRVGQGCLVAVWGKSSSAQSSWIKRLVWSKCYSHGLEHLLIFLNLTNVKSPAGCWLSKVVSSFLYLLTQLRGTSQWAGEWLPRGLGSTF